jgi:streptomycin 6-kinase
MLPPVPIPAKLARTSVAWEGDEARDWLTRLPTIVAELSEVWDLEVGPPYEPGGNISGVAPVVRRTDGRPAVLKVQLPHPESAPEATALAAWAGGGAVLLHAADVERCALLIERCDAGHALEAAGGTLEAVRAGATIGARLHGVAPPAGLPALCDVLDGWADQLAGRLDGHPTEDPGLGRLAVEIMRTRPRACARQVLLHGDLNPTNVLAAQREPWLAIDPKPMTGDPAYDGARLVLQPDTGAALDPGRTLEARLGAVTETMCIEREALVAWCLVDAVQIGTSARSHGDGALADRCAAQVTLVASHLG